MHFFLLIYFNNHPLHVSNRLTYSSSGGSLLYMQHMVFTVRGGADKSLARPTSRCRRTESIVSLERGVCSRAELQVFSCYRG